MSSPAAHPAYNGVTGKGPRGGGDSEAAHTEPCCTPPLGTPGTAMVHCPYSFGGPKANPSHREDHADGSSEGSVGSPDSPRARRASPPPSAEDQAPHSPYYSLHAARRFLMPHPVHLPAPYGARRSSAASPLTPGLPSYPSTPLSPWDASFSPLYGPQASPMYPRPPAFWPSWRCPPSPMPPNPVTTQRVYRFDGASGAVAPHDPNFMWAAAPQHSQSEVQQTADTALPVPVDSQAAANRRRHSTEVPINAPCGHPDRTRMVRIKRGMRRFRCAECGARWKTPCADLETRP